ncbi:hypothetical protein BC827DRAFT_1386138 [Russula dissimulans]|nr:hypothetical protein BC827DRAFT_1386138 [Russula dissimulans]
MFSGADSVILSTGATETAAPIACAWWTSCPCQKAPPPESYSSVRPMSVTQIKFLYTGVPVGDPLPEGSHGSGTGRADIGRMHIDDLISVGGPTCPRNLFERADAAGPVVDIEGRDVPITEVLDEFIKKGETDWPG